MEIGREEAQQAQTAAARPACAKCSITSIILPLLLTVPALSLVWSIALQAPTASVTPQAAPNPEESVYRISAAELYRDYNANAAATQARISEHRVLVTGTVVDISKDYLGRDQVLLDVGNRISAAEMTLDPDQYGLAVQLQRGQAVAVLCERMQRFTDAPAGSGCTLIEPHVASPLPAVTRAAPLPDMVSLNDPDGPSDTSARQRISPK